MIPLTIDRKELAIQVDQARAVCDRLIRQAGVGLSYMLGTMIEVPRAALTSGQIAGAGFDVATVEPPGPDHPLMRLLDLPNFILTPHTAWASAQAIQGLADQLVDNVEAFQAGRPANVVTP